MSISKLYLPESGSVNGWETINYMDGEITEILASDYMCPGVVNRPHYNLAHRDLMLQNKLNETLDALYINNNVDKMETLETVIEYDNSNAEAFELITNNDLSFMHKSCLYVLYPDPTHTLGLDIELNLYDTSTLTGVSKYYSKVDTLVNIALSSNSTIGNRYVNVIDSNDFNVGDKVVIYDGTNKEIKRIKYISGSEVGFFEPLQYVFNSSSSGLSRVIEVNNVICADYSGTGKIYGVVKTVSNANINFDITYHAHVLIKGKTLQDTSYSNVLIGNQTKITPSNSVINGLQISGNLSLDATQATEDIVVVLNNTNVTGNIIGLTNGTNSISVHLVNSHIAGTATNIIILSDNTKITIYKTTSDESNGTITAKMVNIDGSVVGDDITLNVIQ